MKRSPSPLTESRVMRSNTQRGLRSRGSYEATNPSKERTISPAGAPAQPACTSADCSWTLGTRHRLRALCSAALISNRTVFERRVVDSSVQWPSRLCTHPASIALRTGTHRVLRDGAGCNQQSLCSYAYQHARDRRRCVRSSAAKPEAPKPIAMPAPKGLNIRSQAGCRLAIVSCIVGRRFTTLRDRQTASK